MAMSRRTCMFQVMCTFCIIYIYILLEYLHLQPVTISSVVAIYASYISLISLALYIIFILPLISCPLYLITHLIKILPHILGDNDSYMLWCDFGTNKWISIKQIENQSEHDQSNRCFGTKISWRTRIIKFMLARFLLLLLKDKAIPFYIIMVLIKLIMLSQPLDTGALLALTSVQPETLYSICIDRCENPVLSINIHRIE